MCSSDLDIEGDIEQRRLRVRGERQQYDRGRREEPVDQGQQSSGGMERHRLPWLTGL